MKKTSIVFSLVREQSIFMGVIISVLTFLSVLAFGIALSVGNGVLRWNNQWEKYATIQITNSNNVAKVKKILDESKDKIESVHEITKSEMKNLMQPWISSGAKLDNYLPEMFEIKLKHVSDMNQIKDKFETYGKFFTHASALKTSLSAGWKIILITLFILALMLISIGICISYIARNIAMLHKHELEILNQIGASDEFIANQMQKIVVKICSVACSIGFCIAIPILGLILLTAHSARIGLLATLSLSTGGIITMILLPIIIVIFSVYITKRTTLKLLSEK